MSGTLGRIELFLRPGDTLALLTGPAEGRPGRFFCPGGGREFPLYLEMARNAALENGAAFLLIACRGLPDEHRSALMDYAGKNGVPCSEGAWPG